MSPSLVARCSSQPLFALVISRETYTFISYQGRSPSSRAVEAVNSRLWMAAAMLGARR